MSEDGEDFNTSFIDMLLGLIIVLLTLLPLALALIKVVLDPIKDAGIRPTADFVITAEWSNRLDDDVDIWVEDPKGNIVYFNSKDPGLMHLDHDSRGWVSEFTMDADGNHHPLPSSMEIVSLRGTFPGEYTVNVHLYNAHDENDIALGRTETTEVPVRVKITQINPDVNVVFDKEVTLHHVWEEQTATRFTMDEKSHITGFDPTFKHIVK